VTPHSQALVLSHTLATDVWYETRLGFRFTNQTWRLRIYEAQGTQVADTSWIPFGNPVPSVDWILFTAEEGDRPFFFVDDISGPAPRPNAKGDQMQPLVLLTDEDLQRGYVLNWGQPQPPFEPAGPVEVTMAADEYESFELDILAIRDLGKVTLTVQSEPVLPAGAVQLRTQQGVSTAGLELKWEDYALMEGRELQMPRGSFKSFWIRLDTRRLEPGRYSVQLRVQPDHAPPRTLPLAIEVLPVRRLGDDELARVFYHTWSNIRGNYEKHLQLMRRAYARQLQLHFPYSTWANMVSVRRADDGSLVTDFSKMDGLLQTARRHGFDQIGLMGALDRDSWYSALAGESEQERSRARDETVRRMVNYMKSLGFREIWYYPIDEPTIAEATKPETVERFRHCKQIHPDLKVNITGGYYSPEMWKTLNPMVDVWPPNRMVCAMIRKDLEDGVIRLDPTDRLGIYGGLYYYTPPDAARGTGWDAAYLKAKHYLSFAYHQGYHPTVVPVGHWKLYAPDGPVSKAAPEAAGDDLLSLLVSGWGQPKSTPALEAAGDGFEDFAYWHTLEYLLARLDEMDIAEFSPEQRKLIRAARTLRERTFRDSDKAPVPLKMCWGAPGERSSPCLRYYDRWRFRATRAGLLRLIAKLQQLLGVL